MRSWPRSRTLASASLLLAPSFDVIRRRIALTRSTRSRCENGFRMKSSAPILSPNNSSISSSFEVIDELFGLKMGADDFIRKPFSQRLLVERVKAVLRRSAPKDPTVAPKENDAKALDRGLLRMDPERHTCTWKNEPVTLTVTEFL